MNLFDRLKPEIKVVLNKDLELYPSITQKIVDELTSNTYIIDIKYGTATAICYWYLVATNEVAKDLFYCFDDVQS
jgi:hypothetical protein